MDRPLSSPGGLSVQGHLSVPPVSERQRHKPLRHPRIWSFQMRKSILAVAMTAAASLIAGAANAQTATQDITINATVPKLCTVNLAANGAVDTATIAITAAADVDTTPVTPTNAPYTNVACNAPANLQLTSQGGGLTGPGSVPRLRQHHQLHRLGHLEQRHRDGQYGHRRHCSRRRGRHSPGGRRQYRQLVGHDHAGSQRAAACHGQLLPTPCA